MVSVNQSNTTEILHVGTFAGHIGHRPLHVLCGGKGTAPGCAHYMWEPKGTKRSVRNLRHRPEALFALFRQFLQRLSLPRICHFLDLVLPQLTPVRAPWADATRTLWTCHYIRAIAYEKGQPYEPRVTIAYFFTSHDHIHHVRILWGNLPLLLFSDPRMVYPVNVYDFQGQAVHRLHKQHI